MALDTVGPNFSYLEGGVIIPHIPLIDAFIIDNLRKQRDDTRQRIGIERPDWGEPLAPPRSMDDERDEEGNERGYCEFDM